MFQALRVVPASVLAIVMLIIPQTASARCMLEKGEIHCQTFRDGNDRDRIIETCRPDRRTVRLKNVSDREVYIKIWDYFASVEKRRYLSNEQLVRKQGGPTEGLRMVIRPGDERKVPGYRGAYIEIGVFPGDGKEIRGIETLHATRGVCKVKWVKFSCHYQRSRYVPGPAIDCGQVVRAVEQKL